MAATNDFDVAALHYEQKASRGLWGLLKKQEVKTVMEQVEDLAPVSVLDVGCGPGIYAQSLRKISRHMEITGIDNTEQMIALFNKKGFNGICTPAESFESTQRYDCILVLGVLEFSKQAEIILTMAARHLRPHGKILVLVPRLNLISIFYFLIHLLRRNTIYFRSLKSYKRIFMHNRLRVLSSKHVTPISHLFVLDCP